MAPPHVEVAEVAVSQVHTFFESLHEAQAFGTHGMQEAFFVICEQRDNPSAAAAREVQLMIGFAATRNPGFHSFRITHSASGSKIVPVSPNRLSAAQYSPAEIEWVESLARSLAP
jgi:hypothetical protein